MSTRLLLSVLALVSVLLPSGSAAQPLGSAAGVVRPMADLAVLSLRGHPVSVWTGTEMLVWDSSGNQGHLLTNLHDGGRYDPASDIWRPISTMGAPDTADDAAAVWTGQQLVMWGLSGSSNGTGGPRSSTGGVYRPDADT